MRSRKSSLMLCHLSTDLDEVMERATQIFGESHWSGGNIMCWSSEVSAWLLNWKWTMHNVQRENTKIRYQRGRQGIALLDKDFRFYSNCAWRPFGGLECSWHDYALKGSLWVICEVQRVRKSFFSLLFFFLQSWALIQETWKHIYTETEREYS